MAKLLLFFLCLTMTASALPDSRRGIRVTQVIAGLKVSIWEPPGNVHGPYPLIVFSHGHEGGRNQSSFLTSALAQAGYLVVSPDHADAVGGVGGSPHPEFKDAAQWNDTTFRDRKEDVDRLLEALRRGEWSRKIDWNRIGLSGHSLGGYTTLALAGGWPSWKLSKYHVKAVLALSPYVRPLTGKGALSSLKVPVMYQGGTVDFGITPSLKRRGGAFDKTSGPAYFVEFRGAGHLAWTDFNPRFHSDINYYSVAFFDRYLKNKPSAPLGTKRTSVVELRAK